VEERLVSVASLVVEAIAEEGGEATVPRIVASLRRAGHRRVPRAAVERTLVDDARFASDGADLRARWRVLEVETGATDGAAGAPSAGRSGSAGAPTATDGRQRLADLQLRDWQVEALAAWSATCRGVVEAVTGTGKTRLALAAIATVLARGGRALVLVPTLELQDQWARELRALVPEARIGRLGGGSDGDLFSHDVLVATPHSAAAVPVDLPPGAPGLLVADEAHRYGSATWSGALSDEFTLRLALTATYERSDEGVEDVLAPYFGEVVHRYDFDRAVAEGAVAPFRLALVGVELTAAESATHEQLDARVRQLHRELVSGLGMPKDPAARFAAAAALVAEAERTGRAGQQVAACREYLAKVRQRREVAAQAAGKLELCTHVAPHLRGRRTLVFADTVDQAEQAARRLSRRGLRAETVHGELPGDKRRIRLRQLGNGNLDALVAPRVLDEGVDVPDADVALVLAAFRTRRQLVQRLGRVLRRKHDGRHADLVLLHAVGTGEDPARGGHRDFLAQVRPVADDVAEVRAGEVDRLGAWLHGPRDPGG
jgi:superfamily II DNA or RNA helicase